MRKRELLERIEALERRVLDLEHPVRYVPYSVTCTCGQDTTAACPLHGLNSPTVTYSDGVIRAL